MIKGTTEVIGLIGNPVEHSFSPLIHNEIARCMNIDTAYLASGWRTWKKLSQEHMRLALKE